MCSSRLKACEQRRSELFEKQGRGQRFTTMKERDAWIKSVSPVEILAVYVLRRVDSSLLLAYTLGSKDPVRFY